MKESEGQKSGGNLKDSQGNKVEVVNEKKGSLDVGKSMIITQ